MIRLAGVMVAALSSESAVLINWTPPRVADDPSAPAANGRAQERVTPLISEPLTAGGGLVRPAAAAIQGRETKINLCTPTGRYRPQGSFKIT